MSNTTPPVLQETHLPRVREESEDVACATIQGIRNVPRKSENGHLHLVSSRLHTHLHYVQHRAVIFTRYNLGQSPTLRTTQGGYFHQVQIRVVTFTTYKVGRSFSLGTNQGSHLHYVEIRAVIFTRYKLGWSHSIRTQQGGHFHQVQIRVVAFNTYNIGRSL